MSNATAYSLTMKDMKSDLLKIVKAMDAYEPDQVSAADLDWLHHMQEQIADFYSVMMAAIGESE